MKTLMLSVDIYGGLSQYGVYYRLYRIEDKSSQTGKYNNSFQLKLQLEGNYMLFVYGTFPDSENKKATVELDYKKSDFTFDIDNSSENPSTFKDGEHFSVFYKFNTK